MKKLFALSIFLFSALCQLYAQGTLKGKLIDSINKKPLALATVTVFKASDTALITYRLSNPEGEFKVPGLPLNVSCRVVISYSGYDAFRKEFTLTSDAPFDLGTLTMIPVAKSLDEVLVIAERPPVTVKKDTIEFNASSFKTLPTSLVEDLLKKLPGVQVDANGNIMANGKKVNRILVDGKSFFGDDPKMATRNLPANVIDKIQVTEDKDEAARNTDGDLTNVGQVINLTLKKGVKKGWFGKLYAGGGTNDRYEAGGIANIYRDTLQLSVLGFSNNVNRSGFSFKEVQDLGGFNRSGFNSLMVSSQNGNTGFAINGISFGGLGQGLSTSTGAGFNLNHAPNKRKSFFLQYFFGNNKNYLDQLNNAQQFFNDTTVTTRTLTNTNRNGYTHNASAGANLKPDSLTDINFRSSYSYSTNDENVAALVNVLSNMQDSLSTGQGHQFNNSKATSYNHNLFVTRRFASKKGRTLNVFHSLNYNSTLQRYITESYNRYFYPIESRYFDQLRQQDIPTLSASVSANYAEPLSSKFTLRFNNRYDYLKDDQEVSIYDKDGTSSKYDLLDYNQSTGAQRTQNKFNSNLSLSYKIKKLTLTAGLNGLWQNIHNEFRKIPQPIDQHLFNVLPNFSLNWKQTSLQYSPTVSAPSISYMTPVPDSTNPFYIRYGNPYLKPATRHFFYVSNYNFFQGKGATFNFYANGSFIRNDVVQSRTVNAKGVQTITPVNANGTINLYAGIGYGKEYKNKQKLIFSYRLSPNLSFDRRKIIVNNNSGLATTVQYGPTLSLGLNWDDKIEFRPQYSPSISRTTYKNAAPNLFPDLKAVTQYMEGELIVRLPKKLVWESNVAYRYTNQVAPGLPKTNVLWNAAVTYLMFKGDVGMLKLSVFDILNRNNGFSRYTSQNQIVDQQTNVLKRFTELSFTYNIRNMGAPKKVGGKDRLFMF